MQLQAYEIQYFLVLCNATAVMLVKYHFKSTPSLYIVYITHYRQNILVLCNKGSVKYNVTKGIKVTLTFLQVFQFHSSFLYSYKSNTISKRPSNFNVIQATAPDNIYSE